MVDEAETTRRFPSFSSEDSKATLIGQRLAPGLCLVLHWHGHHEQILMFAKDRVSVGRTPDNDLVVADSEVSRHHAVFYYVLGRWKVEDLGSANGSTINGAPMSAPVEIQPGDVIGLGAAPFSPSLVYQPSQRSQTPDSRRGMLGIMGLTVPMLGRIGAVVGGIAAFIGVLDRLSENWIADVAGLAVSILGVAAAFIVFARQVPPPGSSKRSIPTYRTVARIPAALVLLVCVAAILGAGVWLAYRRLAAAPVSGTAVPVTGLLLYQDDFRDRTSGFRIGAAGDLGQSSYEEGELAISVVKPNSLIVSTSPRAVLGDGVIQVDARSVSSAKRGAFGMIFRARDQTSGYGFLVDPFSGQFQLEKSIASQRSVLIKWSASASIRPGRESNRISVLLKGNQFTFYVNEKQVGTFSDGALRNGEVGFAAQTFDDPIEVRFSQLVVRQLPPGY